MSPILLVELLAMPGILLLLASWRKSGDLRSGRSALIIAAYVSVLSGTLFSLYAASEVWRLIGELFSFLLIPGLYFLGRFLLRRASR